MTTAIPMSSENPLDVIAFLHRKVLQHMQRKAELRLKILYPFCSILAVKVQSEQSRIDHWRQKIEIWENLQYERDR